MKRLKVLLSFVLMLCLVCALSAPAYAAGTPYEYRIRIFDGQNGNLLYDQKHDYNEGFNLFDGLDGAHQISSTVGKYYIRGVHLAGKDNLVLEQPRISVASDADYVLSYGITGNMVQYTVRYVEAETGDPLYPDDGYGNRLNWEEHYFGALGDKIIVPSRQVVGYQPQAYNLTKTLVANESENLFVFEYSPETEVAPAPVAPADVVTDQAPNVVIPDGGVPAANQPQQIIDLDEDDTPLGLLDMGKDAVENGAQLLNALPFGARVGLIGLDLVVIGLIIWAIIYARKRKKEQKEENA